MALPAPPSLIDPRLPSSSTVTEHPADCQARPLPYSQIPLSNSIAKKNPGFFLLHSQARNIRNIQRALGSCDCVFDCLVWLQVRIQIIMGCANSKTGATGAAAPEEGVEAGAAPPKVAEEEGAANGNAVACSNGAEGKPIFLEYSRSHLLSCYFINLHRPSSLGFGTIWYNTQMKCAGLAMIYNHFIKL